MSILQNKLYGELRPGSVSTYNFLSNYSLYQDD